jgi:hypothetical protein
MSLFKGGRFGEETALAEHSHLTELALKMHDAGIRALMERESRGGCSSGSEI